jgi:hypothetical protein
MIRFLASRHAGHDRSGATDIDDDHDDRLRWSAGGAPKTPTQGQDKGTSLDSASVRRNLEPMGFPTCLSIQHPYAATSNPWGFPLALGFREHELGIRVGHRSPRPRSFRNTAVLFAKAENCRTQSNAAQSQSDWVRIHLFEF